MLAYASMRLHLLLLFTLIPGISAVGQISSSSAEIIERDTPVPMRDGVVLRADVLRPAGEGRFPVLVYRTPYGKEFALKDYTTFRHGVERGYAVVVQDVRGRYASAGKFRPYENEGRDGYDTIEWAARQPWSNGESRDLRPFLSRRGAVAGGGGKPASPQSHGPGHDVFYSTEFFLCLGIVGPVMDGMDLG